MSGAFVLHRPFTERPESNEDGEKRGVGLGYINTSLDFSSCLFILRTWLCFYQITLRTKPWNVSLLFLPKTLLQREPWSLSASLLFSKPRSSIPHGVSLPRALQNKDTGLPCLLRLPLKLTYKFVMGCLAPPAFFSH